MWADAREFVEPSGKAGRGGIRDNSEDVQREVSTDDLPIDAQGARGLRGIRAQDARGGRVGGVTIGMTDETTGLIHLGILNRSLKSCVGGRGGLRSCDDDALADANGRKKRPVPVREREEIQEMLH